MERKMASELLDLQTETRESASTAIDVPAPTVWPIVLAFGVALLFAGLVTSASVSILGAILAVSGCVGWFRDVLPHEKHESLLIAEKPIPVFTSRPEVAQVSWIPPELHRPRLPLEIYPISAGVKGGLAGSVVMAVLAMIYGIASKHGIWYPINLLAAGFFPGRNTTAQSLLCFRAARFCWEASSLPSCGLVCFTAFLEWSIQCSTSALTGSGLSSRRSDSALLPASWFPGKCACALGNTFPFLFGLGWRQPEPWTTKAKRTSGNETLAQFYCFIGLRFGLRRL